MVKIATTKPPRRLLRKDRKAAMDAAIGPIPPQIERLRRARESIDPQATYRYEAGGRAIECTGRELLRTADAIIALADAHEAGDEEALAKAVLAFFRAGG